MLQCSKLLNLINSNNTDSSILFIAHDLADNFFKYFVQMGCRSILMKLGNCGLLESALASRHHDTGITREAPEQIGDTISPFLEIYRYTKK